MTKHLSSTQISKVLADDSTAEEIRHIRDCAECTAALAQFRETFLVFRGSVKLWTEQAGGAAGPNTASLRSESRAFTLRRLAMGTAFAILIFLVFLPVYQNVNNRHRELGPDDALLLEQINAHLSRAVPAPMEPLMELMSDGSNDEAGGHQ